MNEDAIILELRSAAKRLSAVEIATLAGKLTGASLTQASMITTFKQAFPDIPLRTLLDAGAWARLGGDMSDGEFNELLRPWLGGQEAANGAR
jgi:hypothetical protein